MYICRKESKWSEKGVKYHQIDYLSNMFTSVKESILLVYLFLCRECENILKLTPRGGPFSYKALRLQKIDTFSQNF